MDEEEVQELYTLKYRLENLLTDVRFIRMGMTSHFTYWILATRNNGEEFFVSDKSLDVLFAKAFKKLSEGSVSDGSERVESPTAMGRMEEDARQERPF